ncbi:uncharacterized protein [Oryza sativa Japonica Group]|uniref:uncharacterized protein n=1 Tax=Oryza sativa subsp. japonica TaxID=39947 RepID=UPI00339CD709
MGFVSGIDDFVFPPRQAFRFGSLDFINNDFGKISLLDSDSNYYLSSPGVDSRPTKIVEYDDFCYRYDYRNLDDFDEGFEDNYTPPYFGIFMVDNETEEQPGFKPTGIEKYDGTTNPESWLTVYGLAIRVAGGDSKAMANYLPMALADSAQSCLHGLPRGTIGSWAKLGEHFIANFQGTFERPGTHFDLYNVIQKSGESLRDYIRRFSEQRNKISDITDDVIITAFTKGIRHEDLVGKFGRKPPKTVKQMSEKANEYAKAEDAITASKQSGTTWKPKKDTPTTGETGSTNHKDRKRKPEELVATTTPSSRQHSRINTFDKIMNSQYPHHPNSNHAAKDCFVYKQFAKQYTKNARKASDGDQSTSKKKDDEGDAPTGFQDHRKELNHIFGGPLAYESKRKQKLTKREINAVQPDMPQYLRWLETTIKFDRSDHPDRVVHPGRYPLGEIVE